MPRFSVLIPTRERPETLRHTLATVLSQPGDDYEVVVADNCCGPETRKLVEELASPKLRYTRSDEVLPMAENWERGLALCTGEYVTVLGDDDGFLPSTLAMARKLLDATQAELISWAPHTYWWPDTIVTPIRNLLVVSLANEVKEIPSRPRLESFYRDEIQFMEIPMIYSAFFHRGIIEEAQLRYDGFFVPKDTAPDVASGILGLHITQSHVFSGRPLSIRGNSEKSSGTAQWQRSLGAKQREIYFREERVGLQGFIHKALVPSPNLGVIIASAKLKCKDVYFPADEALTVDIGRVLLNMIHNLNGDPEAYEDNLEDAKALAAKLGVDLNMAAIPPKKPTDRSSYSSYWHGPAVKEDKSIAYLLVNGDLAGLRHIGDAGRLTEALLHPLG
jgi:glycosyltransferase involved in cell wall biosynthesis